MFLPCCPIRPSRLLNERPRRRSGAACAEFALLLPFLGFIFAATLDYGRIFYPYQTIINCARNGAAYGSAGSAHSTDTTGISNAALADAADLSPSPSVSSSTGTDASGNPYVKVTVTYTFNTITSITGIPSSTTLTETVQMRVAPLP